MKIRYNKKRLYANIFIGIVWAIIAIVTHTDKVQTKWWNYGYALVAILYFGQFIYEIKNQYLTIDNGNIRKNRFFGSTLELNKITRIKKQAEDYVLITDKKELIINTKWIDDQSMKDLINTLYELNLPPEKTPFKNSRKSITNPV